MQVTAQARFDAEPEAVAAMYADERFVAAKVEATGALSYTLDVVGDAGGAFTVTTRRHMPTDDIPAQFRSLVGATLEVRQVEAWESASDDARLATIAVEVTGAPVRVTGTARMSRGATGGTVVDLAGDVHASVPIFGSAIEQATARALVAAVEAEQRAGSAWLRA